MKNFKHTSEISETYAFNATSPFSKEWRFVGVWCLPEAVALGAFRVARNRSDRLRLMRSEVDARTYTGVKLTHARTPAHDHGQTLYK
jgi:hypothetical protein